MLGQLIKKIENGRHLKPKGNSLVKGVVVDPIKPKRKVSNSSLDEFEDRLKSGLSSRESIRPSYKTKKNLKESILVRTASLISSKFNKDLFSSFYTFLYLIIFVLILRLIFMDQGVIHYFVKQDELKSLIHTIHQNQVDNKEMISEIKLINSNKSYQKKITRELLGVISPDEYLIIFAQESSHFSK
ncbi:septum formation initiator family protein [Bacteriovoracaceae bacterium]|nr:septum formation initiator family protein [Bacteriovoracaceae bacterium]